MNERKSVGLLQAGVPVLIWVGMVVAIAMEAVVKFQAPTVDLVVGVDVGRHVFPALAVSEWLLLVVALVLLAVKRDQLRWAPAVALGLAVAMLLWQTVELLPTLVRDASLLVAGQQPLSSHAHIWYVLSTGIKVCSLLVAAQFLLSRPSTR